MADDFGRVNPVSPHFLDRGAHEEPYSGRHPRKHQSRGQDNPDHDPDDMEFEEADESDSKNHIDLRI
jgi:hypothetical protein